MPTVVIFTASSIKPEHFALASKDIRIVLAPLTTSGLTFAATDMEIAIIDSGVDTDGGLRLLEEIKRRLCAVPVIFVTPASSEEVVLQAFKGGAREYLRKPLQPKELAAAVEKLLRFKRHALVHEHTLTGEEELSPLHRLPASLPERLQRVVDHIEQNLPASHSLDELAQRACMSKYHFCRLFKRRVGLSPRQFCISRRMEEARLLLCQPNHTVTITAIRVGFNDTTNFIRQFKKFNGLTPGAYRNAYCRLSSAR